MITSKNLLKQPFFWTSVCSLFALGILIGLYSYAWIAPTASPNSNAGAAINFSGGNVGVGTTSPGSKLEVNRTTALGVTLGDQGYIADFIGNAGSSVSNLFITQYRSSAITGHESSEFRLQRVIDTTRMGYIAFTGATGYTERSTVLGFNNTPQLTILGSSGNVGIGTTAPGEKLEVAGNIKMTGTGNGIKFPDGTSQTTAATAGTTLLFKRMFITSTTYTGNLGGLSGADTNCQTRANAVGLGGTWKALLSTSTVDAKGRIGYTWDGLISVDGSVVYLNPRNSRRTLSDITGLFYSVLPLTTFETESGNIFGGAYATGTITGGTKATNYMCSDWTSASSGLAVEHGQQNNASYNGWYAAGTTFNCSTALSLLCIEQ